MDMKVIFLDNDGVICLSTEWGGRMKKQKEWGGLKLSMTALEMPVKYRFDNFDAKAIKILNKVLEETGAEIVVSSDWKLYATVEELGEYYESQGIIKKPIGRTLNLDEFDPDSAALYQWKGWKEKMRILEIEKYLVDHPEITHWVAIDDLNMAKTGLHYSMEFEHEWALENFVHTPMDNEGIKQLGVKEKVLKFLTD